MSWWASFTGGARRGSLLGCAARLSPLSPTDRRGREREEGAESLLKERTRANGDVTPPGTSHSPPSSPSHPHRHRHQHQHHLHTPFPPTQNEVAHFDESSGSCCKMNLFYSSPLRRTIFISPPAAGYIITVVSPIAEGVGSRGEHLRLISRRATMQGSSTPSVLLSCLIASPSRRVPRKGFADAHGGVPKEWVGATSSVKTAYYGSSPLRKYVGNVRTVSWVFVEVRKLREN